MRPRVVDTGAPALRRTDRVGGLGAMLLGLLTIVWLGAAFSLVGRGGEPVSTGTGGADTGGAGADELYFAAFSGLVLCAALVMIAAGIRSLDRCSRTPTRTRLIVLIASVIPLVPAVVLVGLAVGDRHIGGALVATPLVALSYALNRRSRLGWVRKSPSTSPVESRQRGSVRHGP